MLPATPEEEEDVRRYYLSQSLAKNPEARVLFLQKVYAEVIMGHRHDVWDLHASDGRWWIITNPTNLYSQEQFPNMDYAVTFHMGLCLRIPRTEQQRQTDINVRPFASVLTKLGELSDAVGQAKSVSDYQTVGVRCREAMLAFASAAQDIAEWDINPAPKRADFRSWAEVICNEALAGSSQKDRRHLFKTLLTEAWAFSNWLTHAHSATWHDAEAAGTTVEHVLGLALSLLLRHVRSVPEFCPECSFPSLVPQHGYLEELPEIVLEWPACSDCGWVGEPAPVGKREADEEEPLITRQGVEQDECVVPTVPLMKLRKPGSNV